MDKQYRKVLKNLHDLVDDYEDVSVENKVLTHENEELEKDVEYIADEHNKTVEGIRELCNDTRAYRITKGLRNINRLEEFEEDDDEEEVVYKRVKTKKPAKKAKGKKVVYEEDDNEEEFDMNKFMGNLVESCRLLKWKMVFVLALVIVIFLAIGASPSNAVSWENFVDLWIEFICNPATAAMAVVLVTLLYKGIIKRHKK